MRVGIRYNRDIRNRCNATVIAGRVSETMTGPKVRAVALSRGIRHDVAAVHVGYGRAVRADALGATARGHRPPPTTITRFAPPLHPTLQPPIFSCSKSFAGPTPHV